MIDRAWKVFECVNGEPFFMFHGVKGSKKVPLDKIIRYERKKVRDGTGKRWYMSGFHVYTNLDVLKKFLKTLKKNRNSRFVVPVYTPSDAKPKHERSKAHLASEIILQSNDWENRISIKEMITRLRSFK